MRNGTPEHELRRMDRELANWFNSNYPITQAQKYPNGLKLLRESTTERVRQNPAKRGEVKGLSSASMKRLAFLVFTTQVEFRSILTLTYGQPYPTDGRVTKKHLDYFLTGMRRTFGNFGFVWWLEFQIKRPAPHYHILLTLPEPSQKRCRMMAEIWATCQSYKNTQTSQEHDKVVSVHSFVARSGSGKSGAWEGIRKRDGAKWYILKYATKHEQKDVPPGFRNPGRFWGKSRDVTPGSYEIVDVTEDEIRDYLSLQGLAVTNQRVLPKYIIIPK